MLSLGLRFNCPKQAKCAAADRVRLLGRARFCLHSAKSCLPQHVGNIAEAHHKVQRTWRGRPGDMYAQHGDHTKGFAPTFDDNAFASHLYPVHLLTAPAGTTSLHSVQHSKRE